MKQIVTPFDEKIGVFIPCCYQIFFERVAECNTFLLAKNQFYPEKIAGILVIIVDKN